MMVSKHTPGPWRLSDGMIQCQSTWHDDTGTHFDWDIPRILATVTDDWDCEVNGRLIAAAPDLLAALEAMVISHRALCDSPSWDEQDEAEQEQARAAIAKAKGEV